MPSDIEVFTSQHLSLSASFWTWWRTQEAPKTNPAVAPHLLARKYLKGTHEWVNIPRVIVEELVKHSRGAVIQSVEHLPVVQGACSIPKVVLQDCFDVIDTLQESVSFVPNDEVCTTKYDSSTTSTTPVLQSTTPVLLCTTKYYTVRQITTSYYRVLQSTTKYYTVLHSITPFDSPTHETSSTMREATGVTLGLHQILRLPRKKILMVEPCLT